MIDNEGTQESGNVMHAKGRGTAEGNPLFALSGGEIIEKIMFYLEDLMTLIYQEATCCR